jgi:hypothetical protein
VRLAHRCLIARDHLVCVGAQPVLAIRSEGGADLALLLWAWLYPAQKPFRCDIPRFPYRRAGIVVSFPEGKARGTNRRDLPCTNVVELYVAVRAEGHQVRLFFSCGLTSTSRLHI